MILGFDLFSILNMLTTQFTTDFPVLSHSVLDVLKLKRNARNFVQTIILQNTLT